MPASEEEEEEAVVAAPIQLPLIYGLNNQANSDSVKLSDLNLYANQIADIIEKRAVGFSGLEIVAIIGGLMYFLYVILSLINKFLIETCFRADLMRYLYSERDLMRANGEEPPKSSPKAAVMNTQTFELATNSQDIDNGNYI